MKDCDVIKINNLYRDVTHVCERVACYTIYHIPGVKVGCTTGFEKRRAQYPKDTVFEILETWPLSVGDQFAGDCEWWYADLYGYKRGRHYARSDLSARKEIVFRESMIKFREENSQGYMTWWPWDGSRIKIHPAAQCTRLMDDEEMASLVASIKANGLLEPITLGRVNGVLYLVDGRNRLKACEIADVELRLGW